MTRFRRVGQLTVPTFPPLHVRLGVATITPDAAHSIKTPVVWVDCRDDAERAISVINVDAISESEFRSDRVEQGAIVIAYCTIGTDLSCDLRRLTSKYRHYGLQFVKCPCSLVLVVFACPDRLSQCSVLLAHARCAQS